MQLRPIPTNGLFSSSGGQGDDLQDSLLNSVAPSLGLVSAAAGRSPMGTSLPRQPPLPEQLLQPLPLPRALFTMLNLSRYFLLFTEDKEAIPALRTSDS